MTEKILTYDDLMITSVEVYEQMGYHDAEPDAVTKAELTQIISEVSQWLRPQFSYFVVSVQPTFDMGNIILRQLRGSEAYALFICTAGVAYEAYQLGKCHC